MPGRRRANDAGATRNIRRGRGRGTWRHTGDHLSNSRLSGSIPLHLGSVDISYTNSALFMTLVVVAIVALLVGATPGPRWCRADCNRSPRWATSSSPAWCATMSGPRGEVLPADLLAVHVHPVRKHDRADPLYLHLHRQIVVTFALASSCSAGHLVAFIKHGLHFFKFFVPPGAPKVMAPILGADRDHLLPVAADQPSVRLFANMMAGHTMLEVFAGFVVMLRRRRSAFCPLALKSRC